VNDRLKLFVARQPIFDRTRKVFAYELLFRSGQDNYFSHTNQDQASTRVIHDSLFIHGLDKLLAGKKGFVNITRQTLLDGTVNILPKDHFILELLEDIPADKEVIHACQALKKQGYTLALDDFIDAPHLQSLADVADIIKIDFLAVKHQEREAIAKRYLAKNKILLAEKVETESDFKHAISLGYHYFQGYFFCRPQMMYGHDIPSFKVNYMRFLAALSKKELDFLEIEDIIKQEVSLAVKILRYLNSVAYHRKHQVTSIKQALALLGESSIKQWAMLMTVNGLGKDKPEELVLTALIRARFCELLAPLFHLQSFQSDLFILGMLSLMDALVDQPMPYVLEELAISTQIKQALMGMHNELSPVYYFVSAYEQGKWQNILYWQADIDVEESDISTLYEEAILWAQKIYEPQTEAAIDSL